MEGVPVARPVPLPNITTARLRADEILLPAGTRGAAWADLARLIVWLVLLELLAGAVLGIVGGFMLGPQDPGSDSADMELQRVLLLPMLAVRAVGSTAIIAMILHHRRQSVGSVGLGRRGFTLNFLMGIGAVVAIYGLIALTTPLLWLVWPQLWDQMEENAERIVAMVPKLHPLGFVGLAAMIGVYEEVLFRGFLMTRLRRATGNWAVAVLISTVLFTALHALDQTAAASCGSRSCRWCSAW